MEQQRNRGRCPHKYEKYFFHQINFSKTTQHYTHVVTDIRSDTFRSVKTCVNRKKELSRPRKSLFEKARDKHARKTRLTREY